MLKKSERMREILLLAPVVPILVIEEAAQAVPLARALVEGGLPVLEVTLRSAAAMGAIEDIARNVPGAVVGAGTVLTATQAKDAVSVGAQFVVTPGSTPSLLKVARRIDVPTLPGVMTPSEAMTLHDDGFTVLKFFPAEAAGGADTLRALGGPLPHVHFCPTGGVGAERAADYLALANVLAVGGTWVAPADAVRAGDWDRVHALARQAAGLGRSMGTAHE